MYRAVGGPLRMIGANPNSKKFQRCSFDKTRTFWRQFTAGALRYRTTTNSAKVLRVVCFDSNAPGRRE